MATGDNLILFAASYPDDEAAQADFDALREAQDDAGVRIMGAVVMDRDDDGEVHVHQDHLGQVGGGATAGGVVGLVVGLFAPPLLLATAVGAGLGAGIGALLKRHQEHALEIELEDYLPAGSSAIVVVAEDVYLDGIDKALAKSAKKVNKAIDSGDVDKLRRELEDAGARIDDAVDG